jgi:hypothetical protein
MVVVTSQALSKESVEKLAAGNIPVRFDRARTRVCPS